MSSGSLVPELEASEKADQELAAKLAELLKTYGSEKIERFAKGLKDRQALGGTGEIELHAKLDPDLAALFDRSFPSPMEIPMYVLHIQTHRLLRQLIEILKGEQVTIVTGGGDQ